MYGPDLRSARLGAVFAALRLIRTLDDLRVAAPTCSEAPEAEGITTPSEEVRNALVPVFAGVLEDVLDLLGQEPGDALGHALLEGLDPPSRALLGVRVSRAVLGFDPALQGDGAALSALREAVRDATRTLTTAA